MKILHVESGMNLYGGALQVFYLLSGLQHEQDCESLLVCPQGSQIAVAARDKVCKVFEVPMHGDLDLAFIWRLRRIIRQERPDIVHLHSRRGADLLGGLAARRARAESGCSVLLTRRVDNSEPRWWVAIKYRLYDHVVTISEGIRQVLLDEGVEPARVSCVHSAVDSERYKAGGDPVWLRSEFGLPESAVCVGMSAQFIERKGHRYLLEAIPAIVQKHPQVCFILMGKGPLLEAIRAQVAASALLSSCVILTGFRNDLERILPSLDMLVHPADMEGLGVSLLQAAACGLPIVASRAGGIPEIVIDNENGILIEPGAIAQLSTAIIRLLDEPELARQFGRRGQQIVAERFSLQAMVQGNVGVYRRLIMQ